MSGSILSAWEKYEGEMPESLDLESNIDTGRKNIAAPIGATDTGLNALVCVRHLCVMSVYTCLHLQRDINVYTDMVYWCSILKYIQYVEHSGEGVTVRNGSRLSLYCNAVGRKVLVNSI